MANEKQTAPSTGAAQATGSKAIYQVLGPGSVLFGGKSYGPGDPIELTREDAKSLGKLVESADSPQFIPIGKRVDGLYEVVGPGCVLSGKKAYGPGETVHLTADDANSVDVALKLRKAG